MWGVRIAIEAPVTVGDMDVAVEPIGIYSRRVTGEAMAINDINHIDGSLVFSKLFHTL